MMGRSLELSPVTNTFLRNHTSYIHDETSDAYTDSDLTHIHGHGCVPENDVSITMDTEELVGEATEIMNMMMMMMMMMMVADSKIIIFTPTKKALRAWRHPGLFPELIAFVSDLKSELDTSMDEVFRLDLDCSCPSLPAFPLECHMILYDTVGCFVNPLPLEDLPIVGHSDKNTKVIMHNDEGIGVDGLKELDPGPSTHDGIHIDGISDGTWSKSHSL
jgi:hypothetical protein